MKDTGNRQETTAAEIVLDAYLDMQRDGGRLTSQDICDNLRETLPMTPKEVTEYMLAHGYRLVREDDRLVWTE